VSHRRGFTLLEMMVATTIMAVAIVGLFSGIAGATRNAVRLRDYDRATLLARMKMNELLADDNLKAGQLGGSFDAGITGGMAAGWQSQISVVEMPPTVSSGQPCLQRVELQIWWEAGGQRRTFTLDAYRTHILLASEL
jgi:general secretion pathway protein I